jgi:hypothetical protein
MGASVGWIQQYTVGLPIRVATFDAASANILSNTTYKAFPYLAAASETLNTIRFPIGLQLGSFSAGEFHVEIWSDNGGKPGSMLAATTSVTGTLGSKTYNTATGFTYAMTAGTLYWVVFYTTAASPFYGIGIWPDNSSMLGNTRAGWLFNTMTSSNSGSTWSGDGNDKVFPLGMGFSGGVYDGFPAFVDAQDASSQRVYADRQVGVKFTALASLDMNVTGVFFDPRTIGTPTGNLVYKIYDGASLLGTTAAMLPANVYTDYDWRYSSFDAPVVIPAGATARVVMAETTQADSSSNAYQLKNMTVDNNANSVAQMPFGGIQGTYSTDGGSNWSDSSTVIYPFALTLDPAAPFAGSGGGGGMGLNVGIQPMGTGIAA